MKDELSQSEAELKKSIDHLDKDIEKLDTNIDNLSDKFSFWSTFGRGIVGALGAAIGATIIIALLIYLLQKLSGIPVFGQTFRDILDVLQRR